jgi:hypothetical protein
MARTKRRRKAAGTKGTKRRRGIRRGRRAMTARGHGAAMSHAVGTLQAYRRELTSQRDDLERQIQKIDGALEAMGVSAARGVPRGRGRAAAAGGGPRPGSLKAHILSVLSGGNTMAVKDITTGVVRAGYKSKNKTLAKSVGIALAEMPGVAKVGRGRFRAR